MSRHHSHVSLSDAERWLALSAAATLVGAGLMRRSFSGALLAVAATPFLYRGAVGSWPTVVAADQGDDTRTMLGGPSGIHVREAVRVERTVEEVYAFWRDLANLPRFMSHLDRVTPLSDRRSHWVARAVGGLVVEWDAEIINEVPLQTLAWQSMPGADVVSAGSVNFTAVRGGRGTQVAVHLQYAPPAGRAGQALLSLFGTDPASAIREDLRRVKQVLEAGELAYAPAIDGEVWR